jgi:sRNA-binding protein
MTKKSPGEKRRLICEDRARIQAAYPLAFVPQGSKLPKRALKVGIDKDIQARGGIIGISGHPISHWRVKHALGDYVFGRRYLNALAADGAMRIDLDGNWVEPVTDNVRDEARAKIAELDAKLEERKAAA